LREKCSTIGIIARPLEIYIIESICSGIKFHLQENVVFRWCSLYLIPANQSKVAFSSSEAIKLYSACRINSLGPLKSAFFPPHVEMKVNSAKMIDGIPLAAVNFGFLLLCSEEKHIRSVCGDKIYWQRVHNKFERSARTTKTNFLRVLSDENSPSVYCDRTSSSNKYTLQILCKYACLCRRPKYFIIALIVV
jgi:hypothetical protein